MKTLILGLTATVGIAAAGEAPPTLMSRADRLAASQSIDSEFREALAYCRGLDTPESRAVCRAEARADQRVAAASLDARYRGTVTARQSADLTRARAEYALSVARRLTPI